MEVCLTGPDLPRKITPIKASRAPANTPGKNPAAIAGPGKPGHWLLTEGELEFIPIPLLGRAEWKGCDEPVAPAEADAGETEVEFRDEVLIEVAALMRQILLLLVSHTYPNGQQLFPQVGRVPPRFFVIIDASGCAVVFCNLTSQLIVWIVLQFWPSGQHRADEEESRETQVSFAEQQKLPGRFGSVEVQGLSLELGQVESRCRSISKAFFEGTAMLIAVVEDTRLDTSHNRPIFRRAEREAIMFA